MHGWFDNDGKTAKTISISGQNTSGQYDITVVMVMMTSGLISEIYHSLKDNDDYKNSFIPMRFHQTLSIVN